MYLHVSGRKQVDLHTAAGAELHQELGVGVVGGGDHEWGSGVAHEAAQLALLPVVHTRHL